MRFTKMQGLGNDYLYVNGFVEKMDDPCALSARMSDRHFGVGSDGMIWVLPSEVADFRMRMFNADGREGAMCGNGARCIGRFVYEKGLTDKTRFTLETGGGIREIYLTLGEDGKVASVKVDMGVPLAFEQAEGRTYVSLGSEHQVYIVPDNPFEWTDFDLRGGPLCVQFDANIEFVQVLAPDALRMRVFERGSGETLACGSGACASLVAAHALGLADASASVEMRGGTLQIAQEENGRVWMTGPAVTVFEGEWPDA